MYSKEIQLYEIAQFNRAIYVYQSIFLDNEISIAGGQFVLFSIHRN